MPSILDTTPAELHEWLAQRSHPKYRAAQIDRWIVQKRASDFAQMSDLPAPLRQELADSFQLFSTRIVAHRQADDGTEKLLLELADGGRIECVLLRDGPRRSICISTQVGCAMGCVFCASGLDGVERNLSTGEIVEQMLRLQQLLPADERLSHIVAMGMGEPLANLDRLLPALDIASHPQGLGISPRRITISTVGVPPAIERLIERGAKYHLAVSLHAPNDDLRSRIVPVNRSIGLRNVLTAAEHYFAASGRRLTYEYVLLADLNDRPEHARQLAAILRGQTALLNVIPYNPVAGLPYRTPTPAAQHTFREILERAGVNVQFRERKGDQIDAACGQLRRSQPTAGTTMVTLESSARDSGESQPLA